MGTGRSEEEEKGEAVGIPPQAGRCSALRPVGPAASAGFAQRFAQSTLDAMIEQICVLDGAGAIVAFNAAWRTFSERNGGASESVLLGSNYLQACDDATGPGCPEAERFAAGLRQVLCGEAQQLTMEYACHSPDEQRWFVARATRFVEADEVCVVVAHQNVTALKQAAEAARVSERRFRALADSVTEMVFAFDDQLRYTFWNRQCERVTGLREQEVLGRELTSLFGVDVGSDRLQLYREVLRTGAHGSCAATSTIEGQLRHYRIDCYPAEGGLTVFSRDVTDQLELQARLARVERSAAVGTLVAGVAHEINNPLTVVLAGLEFVQEKLADRPSSADVEAETLALLHDAAAGARRIKDVVAALRLIAPGRQSAPPPLADLRRTLDLALALAGHALAPCEAVDSGLPPLPSLALPAADLVQVLTNLLVNAGQAQGACPNRVAVSAAQVGPMVEVKVTDTGEGMAPAVLARAFEPFFTTKGVGAGKGLGLSVAQGIVHAAGGSIHLASAPGAGTCVTFCVPFMGAAPLRP